MVRRQLASRGIHTQRVLAAMQAVPREWFVAPSDRAAAYADRPLAIGDGQTISQPYIVALMTELAGLTRHSTVLEVGAGSGYHAAVLAHLARHVWTVERQPALARAAETRLAALGMRNVTVVLGDGALGYPTAAPYDAIVVAAAAPATPAALRAQLADGGRLVIPVGNLALQDLLLVTRRGTRWSERRITRCRFVPLLSPEAFAE